MQSQEEKILSGLKTDYDSISIPDNIDDFIIKGLQHSQNIKRTNIKLKYFSVAAALVLLLLASGARLSPVFADYLDDVPLLKYIVKLVNYDKGLKAAIDNNFIQNVGVSDEHGGIKFTVDSVIVDEARMIVFYTIENNSEYKAVYMNQVRFADEEGKELPISCSYGFMYDKAEAKRIQDKIHVSFTEGTGIPDVIQLDMELLERYAAPSEKPKSLPYTWQVDIPIDKSKFESLKHTYQVDQTIEVEGQKITINKATVYPTRMAVDVTFAEENTMKLFSFENLKIINAKGEILSTITNDVSASLLSDNHRVLYFESDYFNNPESLYLYISSIRALDKDKADILVDLDSEKMLKAPDDRLKLQHITKRTNETEIEFLLKDDEFKEGQTQYGVSPSGIYDANGKELKITGSGTSHGVDEAGFNQVISVTFENAAYQNPLKISIFDYPSRIEGDFKIKLK